MSLFSQFMDNNNDRYSSMGLNSEHIGQFLGMTATFCFTLQYAPQALLNYQRKSTKGFSSNGIIIKLIGAAFLMINAYLTGGHSSSAHSYMQYTVGPYIHRNSIGCIVRSIQRHSTFNLHGTIRNVRKQS